jgi:hypothetical protein
MLRRTVPAVAALAVILAGACDRPEEVRLDDPLGEPTPMPGPTLAPPVPPDTIPIREDTLPVLQQDTL